MENSGVQRLSNWWRGQSPKRRNLWVVTATALIIAVASGVFYTTRVQYVTLFSGLEAQQASAIVDALQAERVNYRLADNGRSVMVPKDQVHELKIRIAGEGLYNTGVGFELFDRTNIGLTDFERRLNYQRALEEELRRTIVYFPEIEQARVHVVMPEQSVFVQNTQPATASVTVKTGAFRTLSPEQVKGIVYLVTLSVPNLKPENVAVIDVSGRILSDGLSMAGDSSPMSARQSEQKRAFEQELEKKVTAMLERVYGPGKAVVLVSAEMNFDQETVTRIIYDQDGQVVRSEQIREESYNGTSAQNGGIPGTGSNIPTYPVQANGGTDSSSYSTTDRVTNYEINTTQSTVVTAPGGVVSISTAVTVDASLSEEEKTQLNELVQAAVGYNQVRGDSLIVTSFKFNTEHIDRSLADMDEYIKGERMQQYIRYGMMAAGGLLGAIMLFVIISKLASALGSSGPLGAPQAVDLVPLQQAIREVAQAKETQETESALRKVKEMARNQPEEVAQLLKAWFNEG